MDTEPIYHVPLDQIDVSSSFNSRGLFLPESCRELANDIKENGLINPITLRKKAETEDHPEKPYFLVSGFRRLMAFDLNRSKTIPAIVREITSKKSTAINISENINRTDIGLENEVHLLERLVENGYSLSEIKKTISKNTNWIYDRILIARLPPDVQQQLYEGKMLFHQAIDLAKECSPVFQRLSFERALEIEVSRLKVKAKRGKRSTYEPKMPEKSIKDFTQMYFYLRLKGIQNKTATSILAWAARRVSIKFLKQALLDEYPNTDWSDFPTEEADLKL